MAERKYAYYIVTEASANAPRHINLIDRNINDSRCGPIQMKRVIIPESAAGSPATE